MTKRILAAIALAALSPLIAALAGSAPAHYRALNPDADAEWSQTAAARAPNATP
jgi:hypothetical protein